MTDMAAVQVPAGDGRELEVRVSGPEDGFPFIYHHGTPQGAVPCPFVERPAAHRGLRTIAYSRPGYGRSTPRTDAMTATVAADAFDVSAILGHLGLGEFVTLGWSGGGPRALACAALLPDLCRAAALGVSPAPPDAEDFDWMAGMGPENVAEYTAVREGPEALTSFLQAVAPGTFSSTADGLIEGMSGVLPPVDRAALTGEVGEYLAASFRHAGHQGIVGWRDDDLTHSRPWGFDVGDITVPVSIWQGTEDLMVPLAHAVWLSEHVAGAAAHLVDGEGHLSLFARLDTILDDLVERAGLKKRWS